VSLLQTSSDSTLRVNKDAAKSCQTCKYIQTHHRLSIATALR
jgi:hypothetical protein